MPYQILKTQQKIQLTNEATVLIIQAYNGPFLNIFSSLNKGMDLPHGQDTKRYFDSQPQTQFCNSSIEKRSRLEICTGDTWT